MALPARDAGCASPEQRFAALLSGALAEEHAELQRVVLDAVATGTQLADLFLFLDVKGVSTVEFATRFEQSAGNLTPAVQTALEAHRQAFLDDLATTYTTVSGAFLRRLEASLAPESPQQARARRARRFVDGVLEGVTLGQCKPATER